MINLQEKEFQDLKKKHKSTPIPKDENEAKRVYDSFELELADFRTKWQRKMQKFEQEKNEELNSFQQELNVSVVRPISPEPILDPYEKIGKYNATILAQKERERLIQEESEKEAFNQTIESPKKFSQTMQPRSSPQKLSQTMKPKQSPKQTARLATTVKKK
ncbi:hypothetical protein TRFO_14823 [Tritrichomonas foetus]|uniref:Uncharacterized protein n=1 Tax=Tritrichomonas foetus TaxID=1144522 RepID=A0A1J4KYR8_9EUKA|nr:hypothetical protein TRFO_14823 [Tritrichomonas foetus]|eukprot:OHT14854.1 hypothetical protein TRFO_14823 [Tritrichomonas foetus]